MIVRIILLLAFTSVIFVSLAMGEPLPERKTPETPVDKVGGNKEKNSMNKSPKMVRYMRYEYGSGDTQCEVPLLIFVYDIPYFTTCDVLPPFHLINEIFMSGKIGGGMSPGATWEPFSINESEFEALRDDIRNTSIENIQSRSRYANVKFTIDNSFDHYKNRQEWSREVCKKYGTQWLRRVNPEIYGNMDDRSLSNVVESMINELPNQSARPDR